MNSGALVPQGEPLGRDERTRYARHLLLPELGPAGARRLKGARVLVVGAGGLGSPVLLALAAAGVGRLDVVDDDVVDLTNLQRQVIHSTDGVGRAKVDSAAERIAELNPGVEVVAHRVRLGPDNALGLMAEADLVIDGADNFPTRYLVADAAARLAVPVVWGSVYRFDGQVSVWAPPSGPCLACVFPRAPRPEQAPSCAVGGVLGSVVMTLGSIMATEAIKLITGIGEPLIGRLLIHDALAQRTDTIEVARRPDCEVCGSHADPRRPLGTAGAAPADATADPGPDVAEVDVDQVAAWLAAGEVALLDVREPGERHIAAIAGDRHLPLSALRSGDLPDLPGGRVVTYCASGYRSAQAARLLAERGIEAASMAGGIAEWTRRIDPDLAPY